MNFGIYTLDLVKELSPEDRDKWLMPMPLISRIAIMIKKRLPQTAINKLRDLWEDWIDKSGQSQFYKRNDSKLRCPYCNKRIHCPIWDEYIYCSSRCKSEIEKKLSFDDFEHAKDLTRTTFNMAQTPGLDFKIKDHLLKIVEMRQKAESLADFSLEFKGK